MNEIVQTKELEGYKQQVATAEKFSTTLEVKTENDYQAALAEGKRIKEQLEIITARKDEIIKPLNSSLKSVKALFAPIEEAGENALKIVRTKMLEYANKKEAKAEVKIDKIVQKFEDGKISEGEAHAKIFVATPQKTVTTEAGSATVKKVKKYYVVDKSKIPLQFLEPDMVRIKASFKAGTPVDGVEERIENELAIR